jgi:hypothetical protein
MIGRDSISNERTSPLHNYIKTKKISVSREDIYICLFIVKPIDSTDLESTGLIEELTDYHNSNR